MSINWNDLYYPIFNGNHNRVRNFMTAPPIRFRGEPEKRENFKSKLIPNIWYDKYDLRYQLLDDLSFTISGDISKNACLGLVEYINALPSYINCIILDFSIKNNDMADLNVLCEYLSRIPSNKRIILNLSHTAFGPFEYINYKGLPNNVKITNMLGNLGDGEKKYGEPTSFDWWALQLNDNDFKLLIDKLTPIVRARTIEMRNIAKRFYDSFPQLRNLSPKEQMDFTYDFCLKYTVFDSESTTDIGLKDGCEYSQDPIITYKRKKGVCVGRATLMKVFLNNYYLKCPCFLTNGAYLNSDPNKNQLHVWNELRDQNGLHYYDLSFYKKYVTEKLLGSKHRIDYHTDYDLYVKSKSKTKAISQLPKQSSTEPRVAPPPLPKNSSTASRIAPPPLPKNSSTAPRVAPPPLPKNSSTAPRVAPPPLPKNSLTEPRIAPNQYVKRIPPLPGRKK